MIKIEGDKFFSFHSYYYSKQLLIAISIFINIEVDRLLVFLNQMFSMYENIYVRYDTCESCIKIITKQGRDECSFVGMLCSIVNVKIWILLPPP